MPAKEGLQSQASQKPGSWLLRGSKGRHDKELAQAVRAALDRAAASPLQGPASAKRGGRRSPGTDTWDPQWSALSAARAGLRGASLTSWRTVCAFDYGCLHACACKCPALLG